MEITIKEKFQEVVPEEGHLLFLDGMIFEGLCCPLSVNPREIYTEYTREVAEKLCEAFNKGGK